MSLPVILFVDDEPNILKTLQRLFIDEDYDVHTACGGKDALALIEGGVIPTVIVSDQRMPEMGGAEFLEKARELVPDSIRMVLTGYADINAAVDAINLGGIYRYIFKPWNDADLKLTVSDAIKYFNLVNLNRELTEELKEKNKSLSELNDRLEKLVEERTFELHQKVKELQGRDKIQQYLLTVHPIEELLQTTLEVILEVQNSISGAAFFLVDESSGKVNIAADSNFHESQDETFAKFHPVINAIMDSGKAASFSLAEDNDSKVWAVPVGKSEVKFGALLVKCQPDTQLSSNDKHSITGFAKQTAIGISDSRVQDNIDDLGASIDDVLLNL